MTKNILIRIDEAINLVFIGEQLGKQQTHFYWVYQTRAKQNPGLHPGLSSAHPPFL